LVDAAGCGAAIVREDGTLAEVSEGFCELLGSGAALHGALLTALLPELPSLSDLPTRLGADSPIFVHAQPGQRRRVLAAASVELEGARYLVLADRSDGRHRRAQLRNSADAEGKGADDTPRSARVRPFSQMGERTAHALALARRYHHEVCVMRLELNLVGGREENRSDLDVDGIVLGCVRGVDDVGRAGSGRYLLLLPDTDVAGAKAVASRIVSRMQGLNSPSIGIAQSHPEEGSAELLRRAEAACNSAGARGGGVEVAQGPSQPVSD
jgi:hypothetical protein